MFMFLPMKAHLINREKNIALPLVDKISLMPQKEILLHGKRQKVKRINGDLPRPKKRDDLNMIFLLNYLSRDAYT